MATVVDGFVLHTFKFIYLFLKVYKFSHELFVLGHLLRVISKILIDM